jgi:AcrR family transcriptional regulator
MNKNVERGQATRTHLIEVATGLFGAHGYDGTSIEAVLAESGASRGSLYHHFPGKDALFLAVLEEVGTSTSTPVIEAMSKALDPVAALKSAAIEWIRLAGNPVFRQIVLIDAPAVLGFKRWRELDEQGPLGIIKASIAYAADTGRVDPQHVDAFAHMVLAAANEIALVIAQADDQAGAIAGGESAIAEFLDRILGR